MTKAKNIRINFNFIFRHIQAEIDLNGFVSKTQAMATGETPTSVVALAAYQNSTIDPRTNTLTMLGMSMVNWANAHTDNRNDFLNSGIHVLRNGSRTGDIKSNEVAILAAMFDVYKKEMARIEDQAKFKEAHKGSEFMGTLKKRGEFFVKLIEVVPVSNRGFKVNKVVDRTGNMGVIICDINASIAEKGECFLFKGTPVGQEISTYTGVKETRFNRIKVLNNVGAA